MAGCCGGHHGHGTHQDHGCHHHCGGHSHSSAVSNVPSVSPEPSNVSVKKHSWVKPLVLGLSTAVGVTIGVRALVEHYFDDEAVTYTYKKRLTGVYRQGKGFVEQILVPASRFGQKPIRALFHYQDDPIDKPTVLWFAGRPEGLSGEQRGLYEAFIGRNVNFVMIPFEDNRLDVKKWGELREQAFTAVNHIKENYSDKIDWSSTFLMGENLSAHMAIAVAGSLKQDFGGLIIGNPKKVHRVAESLIPYKHYFDFLVPDLLNDVTSVKRPNSYHWISKVSRPVMIYSSKDTSSMTAAKLMETAGSKDKYLRICGDRVVCAEYSDIDKWETITQFARAVAKNKPIGIKIQNVPAVDCPVNRAIEVLAKRALDAKNAATSLPADSSSHEENQEISQASDNVTEKSQQTRMVGVEEVPHSESVAETEATNLAESLLATEEEQNLSNQPGRNSTSCDAEVGDDVSLDDDDDVIPEDEDADNVDEFKDAYQYDGGDDFGAMNACDESAADVTNSDPNATVVDDGIDSVAAVVDESLENGGDCSADSALVSADNDSADAAAVMDADDAAVMDGVEIPDDEDVSADAALKE